VLAVRTLNASINGRVVGLLTDNSGVWEFRYADEWMALETSFALSPNLPLQVDAHVDDASQRQVQWYFDNLLPEENQRTLLARDATIDRADAFALLEHYGAESAGSLTLLPPDKLLDADNGGSELLDNKQLEDRISKLSTLPLTHGANKRMSLAGAQHKLAVIYAQNKLYEPKGHSASTHILKPDHPSLSFAQSVINEWFVMQLAGSVGLTVPPVHRCYVPSALYIIERFDRITENETVNRLHSIDACQLLGMDAAYKYQQGSVQRLADIADACRSTALTRTRLFSWLVFNVLVGNTDAHLKNLSFMVNHEGIELAPIYDLLSTAVYETRAYDGNSWPTKTRLAWPLPDVEFVSEITTDVLFNTAKELGLNRATAQRLLNHQLDRIETNAHQLYEQMLSENESAKMTGQGERFMSEGRCIRSIIHNIVEPMVTQLRQNQK